jgi:acetyl esterase/lipase
MKIPLGLEMAVITAAAIVGALLRYALGRRIPGRSLRAELACAGMRAAVLRSKRRGIPWMRSVQELAPVGSPFLERVDREPIDAGGVPAEWFRPAGRRPERTLVYFHGGGYVIGNVAGYADPLARLALGLDAQVLGVDYRLAPEHPVPAAQNDCLAATEWVLASGVDPGRLALGGDSAGGALTVATLCGLRDRGKPLPAAGLLFCPWTEPLAEGGSMESELGRDFGDREVLVGWAREALAGGDPADPRFTVANAKLEGLPALHIQVGGNELLRDQVQRFADAATAAGVEVDLRVYPGMFHIFQVQAAMVPEGEPALDEAVAFLAKRLA